MRISFSLKNFIAFIQLLFNLLCQDMNSAKMTEKYQEPNCVGDSGVTRTSQEFQVRKKITLKSCQSVISVDDNQIKPMSLIERKLFMKFLSEKNNQKKRYQCLEKMKYLYLNLLKQNSHKQNKYENLFDQLPQQFKKQDSDTLSYFYGSWLEHIGYNSQKNKRTIISKLSMIIPGYQIPQSIKFYQNLGYNYIKGVQRYKMIQNICENGWQFFIGITYHEIMKNQNSKNYS